MIPSPQSKPIQGIIFDNGDILFDAARWRRWLAGYLQDYVDGLTYEQFVVAWERQLVDVYRGQAEYWDRFHCLLTELGVAVGEIDRIASLAKSKGQQFQAQRRPLPDVPRTLERLCRQGVKLAVLSDTESGEQGVRQILRQLEIELYFDAVVASRDVGAVKPQRAAFQFAAECIGLPMSQCAFVGHDIDELQGAMDCGMFAVAYNYHPDAPADCYLQEFSDLIVALDFGQPLREESNR